MKNPTTKTTANANTGSKYKKVCIVLSLVPGGGGLVVKVVPPLVALERGTKKEPHMRTIIYNGNSDT